MKHGSRKIKGTSIAYILGASIALAAEQPPQLTVEHLSESPDFIVDRDAATGSALFTVCNHDSKEVTLDLSVSDFTSATRERLGAETSIKILTDKVSPNGGKLSNSCATLKIDASKLWYFGESSAELRNEGKKIAILTALRTRAPFGVKLEGGDKPEIRLFRLGFFSQGESSIPLRNDDAVQYHIRLHLEVDARTCRSKQTNAIAMHQNSAVAVPVICDKSLFGFFNTGLLKPDVRPGTAVIEFLGPGNGNILATRRIPFTASLFWFPEWFQTPANVVASLLVLAFGALVSVLVTLVLPNYLRRTAAQQRLQRVRADLGTIISVDLSAETVILLSLECSRLEGVRRQCSVYSFDSGATLTQLEQAMTGLERNTGVTKRLSETIHLANDPAAIRYPPGLVERLRQKCADAFVMLKRGTLNDADAAAIEQLTRDAETLAASQGQTLDWLEEMIHGGEQTIQNLLCDAGPPRMCKIPLPTLWSQLNDVNPTLFAGIATWDATPLFPGQYPARDRRAYLLSLFLRIDTLHAIVPVDSPEQRQRVFVDFVNGFKEPPDLTALRAMAAELEQDCYEDDIVEEIKSGRVKIVPEGDVLCYFPIRFKVLFTKRPELTTAAARDRFIVKWNFGHGSYSQTGWEAWHYFPFRRRNPVFTVTAKFSSKRDVAAGSTIGEPVQTTVRAQSLPDAFRHRNKRVEILRFALVLLTATFGIQAARQLLPTTDVLSAMIGVFALGFGATTVRNLLQPGN